MWWLLDQTINIRILLTCVLLLTIIYIKKIRHSIKTERKIARYSIESLNVHYSSIFDNLELMYINIVRKMSKVLKKLRIFNKYSIRYSKYINQYNIYKEQEMDFISNKVIVCKIFLIINIITRIIRFENIISFELLLAAIIGFFLPDFIFIYKYHLRKKQIEKDLLNAIMIMNNSFKAGRSTMQSIELVKNELNGAISEEFNNMYLEISYGLSLEVVFERFSERINLDEVKYITSSLIVLNKTGGDIVKVFEGIEKTLYDKKKLKLELISLTSSSNAMVKILIFLPIVFTLLIQILNPSYFSNFFNTTIGNILLIIIILLYIVYIFIVKKVIRIRV